MHNLETLNFSIDDIINRLKSTTFSLNEKMIWKIKSISFKAFETKTLQFLCDFGLLQLEAE